MLRLSLLGTPEISLYGKSLADQITGRSCALLAYLAVTGQEYTRHRLAALFWDERINDDTLKKVRNLLPGLRSLLDDHLLITRESVAFNRNSTYWLDVVEFRTYLTSDLNKQDPLLLERVLALYRDEFLGSFNVRNAPLFEEWVVQEREALHLLAVRGYECLTKYYLEQNNHVAGLVSSKRLLALEPWHEEAHQQQMIFLAWAGKREAALAQYATCQQILAAEFNSEPAAVTTGLYEQVRRGELRRIKQRHANSPLLIIPSAEEAPLVPPATAALAATGAPERPAPFQTNWHEIPPAPKFYGRQAELKRVSQWVADGCRLLGIFGLSGQGKTALVSHFSELVTPVVAPSPQPPSAGAAAHQPSLPVQLDGIIWRSLTPFTTPAQLVEDWVSALSGQSAPAAPRSWQQQLALLLSQLRSHRCLLVLDNVGNVMQWDGESGRYHPAWTQYSELFYWVGASRHQSCLLLLSRETPSAFPRWEEETPAIRSLQLPGLDHHEGRQLLAGYGVAAPPAVTERLIQCYSGNPLALLIAAETIQSLFNGNVERFLTADVFIFDEFRAMLDDQFQQMTRIEREVLLRYTLEANTLATENIWFTVSLPAERRAYLEAQRSLIRRAWIEPGQAGMQVPHVILEYLFEHFVEQVYQELIDERWITQKPQAFLHRYTFKETQEEESAAQKRRRGLLELVTRQLVSHWGRNRAEKYIRALILAAQQFTARSQSYALSNLTELLHYLEAPPIPTNQRPTLPAIQLDSVAVNQPDADRLWRGGHRAEWAEERPRYQVMLDNHINSNGPQV
ncbi:MAG: AfsR/SARP family transcriptional regulator [Caldilineaceae bacterium]